jgi:hypothetical protein
MSLGSSCRFLSRSWLPVSAFRPCWPRRWLPVSAFRPCWPRPWLPVSAFRPCWPRPWLPVSAFRPCPTSGARPGAAGCLGRMAPGLLAMRARRCSMRCCERQPDACCAAGCRMGLRTAACTSTLPPAFANCGVGVWRRPFGFGDRLILVPPQFFAVAGSRAGFGFRLLAYSPAVRKPNCRRAVRRSGFSGAIR